MAVEQQSHVFLAYVREDAKRVEFLADGLRARGIMTWVDRREIQPGQQWQRAIEDAIRSGTFFIACFSRAYSDRTLTQMNEELLLAIEEIRLRPSEAAWFIPIRLDDCEIPDLRVGPQFSTRSVQWLDMFSDWAKSVSRLALAITPIPTLPRLVAFLWRSIGESTRRLRVARGLSQQQLADIICASELSVSTRTISRLESGKRASDGSLSAIAHALNVPVASLRDIDGRPPDAHERSEGRGWICPECSQPAAMPEEPAMD